MYKLRRTPTEYLLAVVLHPLLSLVTFNATLLAPRPLKHALVFTAFQILGFALGVVLMLIAADVI